MKALFLTFIVLIIPLFFALVAISSARNRLRMLRDRMQASAGQIIALCANQPELPPRLPDPASRSLAELREKAAHAGQRSVESDSLSALAECLACHRELDHALASLPRPDEGAAFRQQWDRNRELVEEALVRFNDLVRQYEVARRNPLARLFTSERMFPAASTIPSTVSS